MVAVSPQALQDIPHVIAVAHGAAKVRALWAAMTGGLVRSLVTTRDTALLLLESD